MNACWPTIDSDGSMLNQRAYNASVSNLDPLCRRFGCDLGELAVNVPDEQVEKPIKKALKDQSLQVGGRSEWKTISPRGPCCLERLNASVKDILASLASSPSKPGRAKKPRQPESKTPDWRPLLRTLLRSDGIPLSRKQ